MKQSDSGLNNLLDRAAEGDETAVSQILHDFKPFVRSRTRKFFLIGGDSDDLLQEGMIGLFEAVKSYDKTRDISFAAFAAVCVERQISSAIKKAARKKHRPLNDYVSIDYDAFDVKSDVDPEENYIDYENKLEYNKLIEEKLTVFEKKVLKLFLEGHDYGYIAKSIDKDIKSVDNALQRVKNKLKKQ